MKKAIVVGSGPAGAAAAFELLGAGFEVTMVDVGLELEPGLRDLCGHSEPIDAGVFLARVRRQRAIGGYVIGKLPSEIPG